jgi:hypothetical protein
MEREFNFSVYPVLRLFHRFQTEETTSVPDRRAREGLFGRKRESVFHPGRLCHRETDLPNNM